jgi:hypothetical protein
MREYFQLLLKSTLTFAYVIVFIITFFVLGYLSLQYQLERPELKLSLKTAQIINSVIGWLNLLFILSSLLILWKLKKNYLKKITIAFCLISLPLIISIIGQKLLPKLPEGVSEDQSGDYRIRKENFEGYPCITKIWRTKDKYDPYNPPNEADIQWILISEYNACP